MNFIRLDQRITFKPMHTLWFPCNTNHASGYKLLMILAEYVASYTRCIETPVAIL